MPSNTNLATKASLNAVENKTPKAKANEIEKIITDHDDSNKYITNPEFNKLASETFATKLKHAN